MATFDPYEMTDCPRRQDDPFCRTCPSLAEMLSVKDADLAHALRVVDILVAFIHRQGLVCPWNDILDAGVRE